VPKSKPRSQSKAEREAITFNRVKNMSSFIEHIEVRLNQIENDLGLLVALGVADDTQRAKILESIQEYSQAVEENEQAVPEA